MRKLFSGALAAVFLVLSLAIISHAKEGPGIRASYLKLPLSFVKNEGGKDSTVLFYEQGSGHATAFAKEGISLSLTKTGRAEKAGASELVTLTPLNASPFTVEAMDKKEGRVNYFIGKDPKKWKTNVATYGAILYKNIYPGIDMKFYGTNSQLEYDVIVSPQADPSKVRLSYRGAKKLSLTPKGELEIALAHGSILQKKPVVYQMLDGKRKEIEGKFVLAGNTYGFEVGAYDRNCSLVIDPVLIYSTYLGGAGEDRARAIAVDKSGNVYAAGVTYSTDFPVLHPYQGSNRGDRDVFVTKYDPSGNVVYSTYIGGAGDDFVSGGSIAVDKSGNVYLAGDTESADFPTTPQAYQTSLKGIEDGFVVKLGPSGGSLIYSTYLGGTGWDYADSVVVDRAGCAYVAGAAGSGDFPTVNPYQGVYGGDGDGFIAKLNPSGSALAYSTYFGGSGYDDIVSLTVDASGQIYVTGTTDSTDLPTRSPLQAANAGKGDAFIAKFSASGSALVYSTYLGGSDADSISAITTDSAGNAYVMGTTKSTDFPTSNPYRATYGGGFYDAFIAKLNPSGSALVYSTYLGGSDVEYGDALAVDSTGHAYAAGATLSTNFPVLNAYQKTRNQGMDCFITKLSPSGAPVYSTYLGGSGADYIEAVKLDSSGYLYLAGYTSSTDFPTESPYQAANAGGASDGFVAKMFYGLVAVQKSGAGSGAVTSSPAGIDCGTTCYANFDEKQKVILTPTPAHGSSFAGWSGDCKGTKTCTLTVTGDKAAGAEFSSTPCTYTISPGTKKLTYKGGPITITVNGKGAPGCAAPQATGIPAWATLDSATFSGTKGTIKLTVPALNSSQTRTGTIGIEGNTFTLTQTGKPCTFALSSYSSSPIGNTGGSGSFNVVDIDPSDCTWKAAQDGKSGSWLHFTLNGAEVDYTVDANTGTGAKARTGKITVTLDQNKKSKAYTVKQDK